MFKAPKHITKQNSAVHTRTSIRYPTHGCASPDAILVLSRTRDELEDPIVTGVNDKHTSIPKSGRRALSSWAKKIPYLGRFLFFSEGEDSIGFLRLVMQRIRSSKVITMQNPNVPRTWSYKTRGHSNSLSLSRPDGPLGILGFA